MTIQTLLFAHYREQVGTGRTEVQVPDGSTVSEVLAALRGRGGSWATLPESPAVAVNREYVRSDVALSDGDELALIPPVAGG